MHSRTELDGWLREGFEIERQKYYQIVSGELWAFGDRLQPPRRVEPSDPHQLTCVSLRAV
ncbi:MAG: hypothetical protein AAGF92_21630 [Myxococcota bacterium]